MNKPTRLCIDCRHCEPEQVPDGRGPNDYSYETRYLCSRAVRFSPVDGRRLPLPSCETERVAHDRYDRELAEKCGTDARYWQPKPQPRFWTWFKHLFGASIGSDTPYVVHTHTQSANYKANADQKESQEGDENQEARTATATEEAKGS